MDNGISKEVVNELERIKNTKDTKALGLDDRDIVQFILKSAEDFQNIYLAENQEKTNAIQELGKKHSLSQEDITKYILEDKEKFIQKIITSLSVYQTLCSLYLKNYNSDEPPQKI